MDFQNVLASCADKQVGLAVLEAVATLFERDHQLLKIDASERSIAAKIAQYLQPHFPNMDIDVEYNRMGEAPKEVAWDTNPDKVYPDIIVHLRERQTNLLAIELKKDSNQESKSKDILKLKAYRTKLGYKYALFMRLGVKDNTGKVAECEWVNV